MAINLDDYVVTEDVDVDSGTVKVAPAHAGGQYEIEDSTGTTQVSVSDAGADIGGGALVVSSDTNEVNINESNPVDAVVNTFNHSTVDADKKLATVDAIRGFVDSQISGGLEYQDLATKAEFDAFLLTDPMPATIVLVTDSSGFNYTDTKGIVSTGLTWWLGICEHFVGEDLVTSTLFTSNSQDSLTGQEIKAALFAQPDTNNYDDVAKAIVDSVPNALNNKLDAHSTGVNVRITNDGSGDGSLELENTAADLDERLWRFKPRADGSVKLEALDDGGNVTETFEFDQSGAFKAKTIKQNNYSVVSTSDPMYVLLSALFGIGSLTQDVVATSSSGSALTFKVADNADGTGIAWQNTGSSYSMSVRRESVGQYTSDLVISMGLDNDIDELTEVCRVRCDDGDSGTRLSLAVKALHADGDITSNDGNTLMNTKNFGTQRQVATYKSSHPTISDIVMASYFAAEAELEFLGTSSGSINMPVISGDPNSDEVQAGTEISFCNFNSGSSADTTLIAPDDDHVFMVGNVGNVFTDSTVIQNASQVKIKARDYRGYSGIGKMCYVVVSA